MGKEAIAAINPSDNEQDIVEELTKVSEFLASFDNENHTQSRI